MSLQLVTRRDATDAVRSRMVWGIVTAFVVVLGTIAVATGTSDTVDATEFLIFVGMVGGELVVPIAALVVGFMAVAGERHSGRLRILHGLPHSRRDIVFGKAISRAAVIVLATLTAFVAAGMLTVIFFENLSLNAYVTIAGLTTLLGLAFVGISVGISAVTATRGRAMAGAIGSYLLFGLLWEPLIAGVHYLVRGEVAGLQAPGWYFFLKRLSPVSAYMQTLNGVLDQSMHRLIGWYNLVENTPNDLHAGENTLALSNRVAGDLPFYLTDWFTALLLLAWFLLPVAIGYWWFAHSDL